MTVRQYSSASGTHQPEDCSWRSVVSGSGGQLARCRFLQQLFGHQRHDECDVTRDICSACCNSFPPTFESLNPVIASVVYGRADRLAQAETEEGVAESWRSLRHWAQKYVEIDAPALPELTRVPVQQSNLAPAPPLTELLPSPARCGNPVQHWSVGLTTAPRRRSRLRECLQSLSEAGWPRPHLFIDGAVTIPHEWSHLPMTSRDEQVGAWPNYYLALLELLMREPLADAFMLVQDDVEFYCRENVRQYLEQTLWLGATPGIVSLYCATPDTRAERGWFKHAGRWNYSSLAFIFPREIAQQLVVAPAVFRHRWAEGDEGRVGIPDVIADWAVATSTPLYFPSPSLVQHIGETSAIWLRAFNLSPARRAGRFLGDTVTAVRGTTISADEQAVAEFPEAAFQCSPEYEAGYQMRVALGCRRMADATAVICGLCRDVESSLSATIARLERIAGMFRSCGVVVFENDSIDDTPAMLRHWAGLNPAVRIVSERLEQPAITGGRSRNRTEQMAYYRNRCRERVLQDFYDCDFCLVADMDLAGGWSYDGLNNTFGYDDWDFVGSNGLRFTPSHAAESLEYWDLFAYRAIGQHSDGSPTRKLRFCRGEPLVPVWSCFGGLGVYRMDCFKAASYDGADCEHVTFHQSLRERGFDRLFLNPSQIALYSPWSRVR
jgi:hypothetical protein